MKTLETLAKNRKVEYIDDERNIGNGIIITLKYGFRWEEFDNATVRGFDTVTEARDAVRDAIPYQL
jgi:hypothetical protein